MLLSVKLFFLISIRLKEKTGIYSVGGKYCQYLFYWFRPTLGQVSRPDGELGASCFFILREAVRSVHAGAAPARSVTGVSLQGQARAVCLCFVNRDYERAAGRQVGGGGDSPILTRARPPPHSVSLPLPFYVLLPLSPNNQHPAHTVLPKKKNPNGNGDACQTNSQEV